MSAGPPFSLPESLHDICRAPTHEKLIDTLYSTPSLMVIGFFLSASSLSFDCSRLMPTRPPGAVSEMRASEWRVSWRMKRRTV